MRTIFFLILLSIGEALYAQSNAPNNFNSATKEGEFCVSGTGTYTDGVYTFNPRIENGYYCVDIYARCFDEKAWEAKYGRNDCSCIIGSLQVSVNTKPGTGNISNRFEEASFSLSPAFFYDEGWVLVTGSTVTNDGAGEQKSYFDNIKTAKGSWSFVYRPNTDWFGNAEVKGLPEKIIKDVPYYLGTLKLKIKAGAETQKSGFQLIASASSVGVWDLASPALNNNASINYTVVGFLDGKDIDISLSGETEPQIPDKPVFASGKNPACPDESGAYKISAANNATSYEWWVSTDAFGNNRVTDNGVASLTEDANGLGVSVNWGTNAAGKTYYVCVKAKNDQGESEVTSYLVQVGSKPNLNLVVNGGTEAIGGAYCGGTQLNLQAASSAESGVTYAWQLDGSTLGGSSYQLSGYTLPNTSGTHSFTVTATKGACTASADLSVTVQPSPQLALNPALESSYPNGSVVTLGVIDEKGNRLESYTWTQPVQSNATSLEVNVDGQDIPYSVTASSNGCSSTLTGKVVKSQTGGLQAENVSLLFANSTLCQGGVLPLVVNVSGLSDGTTYTYTWYKGTTGTGTPLQTHSTTQTEDIYAAQEAGDYTVVISTNTGLRLTRTGRATSASKTGITVETEPVIYAVSGTQVVLISEGKGGSGYVYKWRPVNGLASSGEAEKQYPLTKAITGQTDYQVYVADGGSSNRCVAKGETRVALTSTLPSGNGREYVLNVSPENVTLCRNSDLRLQASVTGSGNNSVAYSWWREDSSNGLEDENTASPLITASPTSPNPMTYYVKATVGTGANAKVMTKALNFSVNNNSAPVLRTPGMLTVLPGESAILSAYANPRETSRCTWHWSGLGMPSHLPTSEQAKQFASTTDFSSGETESFRVYMIDENGCYSNEANLIVDVKDENAAGGGGFDVDIDTEMDVMCANTSQNLGVSLNPPKTGVTYEWYSVPDLFNGTGTSENPKISPTQSGDYQIVVTVTDANGKKNTAVKTITMSTQAPNFTLASSNVCQGSNLQATTNGIATGTYKWYVDGVLQEGDNYTSNALPSEVLANDTDLGATNGITKTVRVVAQSNAGCSVAWENDVTVHQLPTLSWSTPLPNSTEAGTALTVGAVATPSDRNYTWQWSGVPAGTGSGSSYTVTPGADDDYVKLQVTATDQFGCTSEILGTEGDGIMVEKAMSVEIVQDGIACTGGSVVLKARNIIGAVGPYTYEWKDGSIVLGSDSILVVNVNGNKTYNLLVRAANNGNEKTKETSYTVNTQSRTAPSIVTCPDITIGYEGQAVLTADVTANGTQPFSWNWRPETKLESVEVVHQQSPLTQPLQDKTTFYVYVKDANGCVSQEETLNINIDNEFNPQRLTVEILPKKEAWCIGNNVEYAAVVKDARGAIVTSGLTVQWKASNQTIISETNSLQAVYQARQAGSDTVVVVVGNGSVTATAKQIITVKNERVPSWNLAANSPHCIDSVLNVEMNGGTGVGNYQWFVSKDGGAWQSLSGNDKTSYTFTEAGMYEVKVVAETAECSLDTLRKSELTIIPIPEVKIEIPEVCGTAEVVAMVTNDTRKGYTWEWKNKGTITGEGTGSTRTFAATEEQQNFEGAVIMRSPENCPSALTSFNGTVYALPNMTMSPQSTVDNPYSVYPKTQMELEGRWSSQVEYQLQWYQDGELVENATSKTMTTSPLLMNGDEVYIFKLEAINKVNTTCKREGLIYIAVDENDFGIDFGEEEIIVCSGVEIPFYAKPVNDKNGGLIFKVTSDYPEFVSPTTADGHFTYTFEKEGTYYLQVSVTDQLDNTRTASKTVIVKPSPELAVNIDFGREYSLCEWGGKQAVELTITSGTPRYTVNYRWGNNDPKALSFDEAGSKTLFTITEAGVFYLDSLVDINGCKVTYTNQGFEVKDDMPKLELASETVKKCAGGTTDLGITITQGVFPLTLEYQRDAITSTYTYQSAGDRLALDEIGTYTLVSLTSEEKGCAATINSQVVVENFDGASPLLTVNVDGTLEVCGEGQIEIPISITGGAPVYVMSYTKEGDAKEYTHNFEAEGNHLLPVTGSGKFMILKVTDANGCSSPGEGVPVEVQSANPIIHIDSMDFAAHANEPFILGVKDRDDKFTYSWKKLKVDGDVVVKDLTPRNIDDGTYSDSLNVDDGDLYYVLRGASKELAGCYGWDTVYVYKIPNAPLIKIDTAETGLNDLAITFDTDEAEKDLVDGYRLMHNKWDGYAIESEYSEKSIRPKTDNVFELKEADLDTLEFFYAMSSRTITIRQNGEKRTYFSLPSDTVGYKVDELQYQDAEGGQEGGRTSNNPIAWIFDMPGIQTSEDLFNTDKEKISAIRSWVMNEQSMAKATTKNPSANRPGQSAYRNVFDLEVGKVYEVAVKQPIKIIQYGKLGDRLVVNFENSEAPMTNNNLICMLLHKIYMKNSDVLFDELEQITEAIRSWVFAEQSWAKATTKNPSANRPGQAKYRNVFRLIPGFAIQIAYKRNSNQTMWE